MAPVSECSESAVSFDPARKRTMKIAAHLVVALWAAVGCSSAKSEDQGSELSRAAAAQLQRLAPFRRSGLEGGAANELPDERRVRPRKKSKAETDEFHFEIPIDFVELFRIFSPSAEAKEVPRDKRNDVQLTPDRMLALDKYADKLMQDERVQRYMQERIKRDGYGGGYGGYGGYGGGGSDSGGSGAFVSGLAGQLVGSVVGLSTSSSKGSSSSSGHSPAPVYGPPSYHSYGKESFNIWDFKRAILNTLIQAVKAIGGGVLALKGQLIKGSGFLVSTKGRIISSAGQAITGLGKNLASSAVVQPPPAYSHPGYGYAYEAPQVIAHDANYNGPPPSPDAYHTTFGAASDDVLTDVTFIEDSVHQPGLLFAKPTPSPDEVHSEHIESDHFQTDHHFESEHVGVEQYQPETISIEHEHDVSQKPDVKELVSQLTHASNLYKKNQNKLKPPANDHIEETPAIPANTLQLQEHNQDNYELYPPLGTGPPDDQKIQQPPKFESPTVDFNSPPANLQNNYHTLPTKYGLPSADFHQHNYLPPQPFFESHRQQPAIQIEISDHDITGFETGGYGYAQRPLPPGLHVVAMQGPLKIPIIGPGSTYYKPGAFPYPHVNSLHGIGKFGRRYGPSFQLHQSIGYDMRKRREVVYAYAYYPHYGFYRRSWPWVENFKRMARASTK